MSHKAHIVIGAGYGDEGKGLTTDHLCHSSDADLVVRFNGGAQAGHTVVTPDGRRHVFGHFGSGTFCGVPTYLSEYFVVNPMLFVKELIDLKYLVDPKVYIDSKCTVTTPYDVIINQVSEDAKGDRRHGSVGVGFGETIERSEEVRICVGSMRNPTEMRRLVEEVRHEWFPKRAKELGLDMDKVKYWESLDLIQDNFMSDCWTMISNSEVIHGFDQLSLARDCIVMEGAQGLMLDMDFGTFPHVTRSNTGLKNAIALCESTEIYDIEAYYVTRSYVTRHGAGPLSNELRRVPYKNVVDDTNLKHNYQGQLRFSYLDVDVLRGAIRSDLGPYESKVTPNLVMTCMDQLDDQYATIIRDGKMCHYVDSEFPYIVNSFVGFDRPPIVSAGPTRSTIARRP